MAFLKNMFIKVMKTLHKIQNIQNIFCNFGNKNSASWSWLLTNQLNSGLLLSHILFLKDCLLILNVENMLKNGKNLHVDFFFFFLCGNKGPPSGENAVGLSFCKSSMIQGKNSYLKYIQIKDSLRSKYKSVELSIYGPNII